MLLRPHWVFPIGLVGCASGLPSPQIEEAGPALVCDNANESVLLTIRGQHLGPVVAGAVSDSPSLRLPRVSLQAESDGGAIRLPPDRLEFTDSTRIDVLVDRGLALSPGSHGVLVEGAVEPSASAPAVLQVIGTPTLEDIEPGAVCPSGGTLTFTLTGQELLVVNGETPTIELADQSVDVVDMGGCEELPSLEDTSRCTLVTVELPADALDYGIAAVTASNAAPADCGLAPAVPIEVLPPPQLDAVAPSQVCNTGGTLTLTGTDLIEGSDVWVGEVALGTAARVDDRTLAVELPPEGIAPGTHPVSIRAPGGCEAELPEALTVSLPPVAFAVDPPVAPAGVPISAQASLSDVFAEITDVHLLQQSSGASLAVDWSWDPGQPDRVDLSLPGDLEVGVYTVVASQGEDCPGTGGAELQVVDALDIPLSHVEPDQAWTYDNTPVELHLQDPLPDGSVGVQDGARAWIVDPTGVGDAERLRGVVLADESTIAGVVPYGLALGEYDILVVNPDGTAGRLSPALSVVEDPPPRIDSTRPATIDNSGTPTVFLRGRDFRTPDVSFTCRDGGVESTRTATVVAWSRTEVELRVDPSGLNQAVCVITVENEDGTRARYSALTVTNPAQNLFPWRAGPDLLTARRAPAAAAGRTTSVRRWLYAIGGDDGDASGAMNTIEIAPVGVYGDLGDWWSLPRLLPAPRTLASVTVVPPYVYLVGGDSGSGVVDTTWRARILDPLDVPWFEAVSLASDASGLEEGTWIWRVSATFPADDPHNPSGETLAADPLPVTLPEGEGWSVGLRWTEVEGASGYRIYRSPVVDAATGQEEWVADTTEAHFLDAGQPTDPSIAPLLEGSLGAWAEVATLTTARRSGCMVQAPDPHPDPIAIHLYMAGGADASGELLDSIERLTIFVETPDTQAVDSWELIDVSLSRARERCAAMSIDSRLHTVVDDGESWVVFAGGATRSGAVGTVDSAYVDSFGQLTEMDARRNMTPARAGFAGASASNFLYAFGGQQDRPSGTGVSAELDAADLPDVDNWNSLGTSLTVERWLAGSAQESAVMFVVGGETNSDAATTAVDWTNF